MLINYSSLVLVSINVSIITAAMLKMLNLFGFPAAQ